MVIDVKKVVLGMSGGVDSSVAAILLQEQGYEVIGVTFIFTDDFNTDDAEKICKLLNIQHYIKDYRTEFKQQIIDRFISDYKNGMTPNPCVICNKQIKIKYLIDAMHEYNADFVATGHYAQIIDGRLYKSKNINKDQSYFLSLLSKSELEKILFPLEHLEKDEVRNIAEQHGLINSNKKDSFDICFIPNSFQEYMSNYTNSSSGPIVEINSNKIVGTHKGLAHYTIGQRKGLNLGGNQERLFVVKKDIEKNVLYVGGDDLNSCLYSSKALIENVNWISDLNPEECSAKFRYRQEDNAVRLEYLDNNSILVTYPKAIKAVTPGQICVFYNNNECLGGGIIKDIYK
ncbi:MAG: tRNA 2-thiouridine(34) synthase MnmA [Firmicutes bacterium]|nr:tRNA 2-thiouridine(34) synthase MnmA [Bacillota bacterium]